VHCERKLKLSSHNASYRLIEVVTKADLTELQCSRLRVDLTYKLQCKKLSCNVVTAYPIRWVPVYVSFQRNGCLATFNSSIMVINLPQKWNSMVIK